MIVGIGCDMVEIDRMQRSISSRRFCEKCFSKKELEAFEGNASKLAGCFAAKEALGKALTSGIFSIELSEISVLRGQRGEPYFEFCGDIKNKIEACMQTALVSITNTKSMAVAFVVLEAKK
ncbi:MAG: holo-ACP synthase [Oscillospiraceae bacterium]